MRARLFAFSLLGLFVGYGFAADEDFQTLFPDDGPPKGWSVREWNDLTKKVDAPWTVKDGVAARHLAHERQGVHRLHSGI